MPVPFSYQRSPAEPARLQAVINANTIGVDKTNEGNRALKEGQHDKALRLHQEALNLKIQGYGLLSLQAAVSWNALGETYLAMGGVENLKKAAELLERVLWTRVDKVLGGRKLGVALADAPRDNMALKLDAAVSRENLARVLEAQFKVAAAGTLRRTGDDFVGGVVCGNDECITRHNGTLRLTSALQACSGCTAVFYCDYSCKMKDWIRHSRFCGLNHGGVGGWGG